VGQGPRHAIGGKEALEVDLGDARQAAIGVLVVHGSSDPELAPAARAEALLERKERVLLPACAAAEVELLEPILLAPARGLVE
jgi:hypothetical protein